MNILLDLAVVIIVLLAVISGGKRGFLKTLLGGITVLAMLVAVLFFAGPLGRSVSEKVVSPLIADGIIKKAESKAEDAVDSVDDESLLKHKLFDKLINNSGDGILQTERMKNAGATLKEFLVKILSDNLMLTTLCVLITALLMIIVIKFISWLIGKIINPVRKIGAVRRIDGFLGCLMGVVNAVLILGILVAAVNYSSSLYTPKTENGSFESEIVNESVIYKYVSEYHPISLLDAKGGNTVV